VAALAALITEIEVSQLVSEKTWGYLGMLDLVSRRGNKNHEGGGWLAGLNRYRVLADGWW